MGCCVPRLLSCDAPYARGSRAGAHMRVGGDGAPRHRTRHIAHAPACAHAAAHAGTSAGGPGSRVVSGAADRTRGGGWRARGARASRQSWVHAHRAGGTRRATHATPLPPLPCSRSLPRALALVPGVASDAPALPCLLPPSAGLCRGGAWQGRGALVPAERRLLASFPSLLPDPSPPAGFAPFPSSPHYSPPHQDLARTCRTRRAGAGATGSDHERTDVPRAAAAAVAAPSSAAFGCWRARALARCARAALTPRSRCARAAMHTRRPPGSRSRGQSTTTAAAPPPHLPPLVATVPSSFMPTLARALSLSRALSRSRVIMLSLRSRCAHTRARVSSLRNAALASPHPRSLAPRSRLLPRAVCACFCVLPSLAVMCVIDFCLCAHTRTRVLSLRNAALAPPHPRSLAPRSRLLPRAVWACFLSFDVSDGRELRAPGRGTVMK